MTREEFTSLVSKKLEMAKSSAEDLLNRMIGKDKHTDRLFEGDSVDYYITVEPARSLEDRIVYYRAHFFQFIGSNRSELGNCKIYR